MPAASKVRATSTTFDWAGAHARIERAIAAIESAADPSPEYVRRVLRERAERYAKAPARASDAAVLDVIIFLLDGLRFGIELSHGSAVTTLASLTYVPGLPSFYMGVLSHRGNIYPIARLQPLLSMGHQRKQDSGYGVLMREERGMLGLAVDEILGVSRFSSDAIALAPNEATSNRIVLGIGPDATTIINASRLLMDARLVIDDQPDLPVMTQGS